MCVHSRNAAVDYILCKCIGTHSNNRYSYSIISSHSPDFSRSIPALHLRHQYIHDNHIIIIRSRFFKPLYPFFSIPGTLHCYSIIFQHHTDNIHIKLIVFYYQSTLSLNRYIRLLNPVNNLFFTYLKWYCHYRCCANTLLTGYLKLSTHMFNKLSCYCKTKSRALVSGPACLIFL